MGTMTDKAKALVERLRVPCFEIGLDEGWIDAQRNKAADRIEALEAENERLRLDVETGRRLEREAIVAWLRTQDDPSEKWALQNSHWYAAEIEAGEHLK